MGGQTNEAGSVGPTVGEKEIKMPHCLPVPGSPGPQDSDFDVFLI